MQDTPEYITDTAEACDLAAEGLFIHDIDPLVPEFTEDFFPDYGDDYTTNPSPANGLINDSFFRN